MGIRCCCPNGHKLNVKAEQAGKIGICPVCKLRFQIPFGNAQKAVPDKTESSSDLNYELVQAGPFVDPPYPMSESEDDPSLSSPCLEELGNSADLNTSTASSGEPRPDSGLDDWYILGVDGREYGPVSRRVIQNWIKEKRIDDTTIVWQKDDQKKEARDVFPDLASKKAEWSNVPDEKNTKTEKNRKGGSECGCWFCIVCGVLLGLGTEILGWDGVSLIIGVIVLVIGALGTLAKPNK